VVILYGMRPTPFVLETLSHFVRGGDGPPPGITRHVDPSFETSLAALCVEHGITPIIYRSLQRLALPPEISRLTLARLEKHAAHVETDSGAKLRLLKRASIRLAESGIASLALGDALTASLYPDPAQKAVRALELLVDEGDIKAAITSLEEIGFAFAGTHPVLAAGGSPHEVALFHACFAPLVLTHTSGEQLRLCTRCFDIGLPEQRERSWDRATFASIGGEDIPAISWEDQLIRSMIAYGATGLWRLGDAVDAGLILKRFERRLDLGYVMGRARVRKVYGAVYVALAYAGDLMHLGRVLDGFDQPPVTTRSFFRWWWKMGTLDYITAVPRRTGRFAYGLIACGGPLSKMRWAYAHVMPKRAWIEAKFGAGALPWRWLKFLLVERESVAVPRPRMPETADERARSDDLWWRS